MAQCAATPFLNDGSWLRSQSYGRRRSDRSSIDSITVVWEGRGVSIVEETDGCIDRESRSSALIVSSLHYLKADKNTFKNFALLCESTLYGLDQYVRYSNLFSC